VKDPAYQIAEVIKVLDNFESMDAYMQLKSTDSNYKMAASNLRADDGDTPEKDPENTEVTPEDLINPDMQKLQREFDDSMIPDDASMKDFFELLKNEEYWLSKRKIADPRYRLNVPDVNRSMMRSAEDFSVFCKNYFGRRKDKAFKFLKEIGFKRAYKVMRDLWDMVWHEDFNPTLSIEGLDMAQKELLLKFNTIFNKK
jgi:hypothetical protein